MDDGAIWNGEAVKLLLRPVQEAYGADAPWVLLGGLCALLLMLYSGMRLTRWWRSGEGERVLKRRQRRAFQAEEDAAGVLRAHGYQILDEQVEHHWTIDVNGEPFAVDLRADYMVKRGGKRYIAEVKSGMSAPSLTTAATRRQLLEYRVAYDVEGILLVDMQAVELNEVDFGDRVEGREGRGYRGAAGFALGVLTGVILSVVGFVLWALRVTS